MTNEEALHTAGRRYCMERRHLWASEYSRRQLDPVSPEARSMYPRYQVLDAILWAVEEVVASQFGSLATLRAYLVVAGQTADSDFTHKVTDHVAFDAIKQERDLFVSYVEHLSQGQLSAIEPLPYRRVLSAAESRRVWAAVDQRWGTGEGYWYPLRSGPMPDGVVAFHAAEFRRDRTPMPLRDLLSRRGINVLWELREGRSATRPEYELEVQDLDPYYDGREGYWTSGAMDWLLYASHEGSMTVAGQWLVDAITAAWPHWRRYLYRGWWES